MDITLFKEIIADFLVYLEVQKNLSSHTLRAYQNDLSQLTTFWQMVNDKEARPVPFDQVVQRHVLALFHKKLSKASLARKFSCLRTLKVFAMTQGHELKGNFKSPKIERKLPVVLSIEEITHLLDEVKSEDLDTKFPLRDKAIFETLYATGVRCAELINIKLSDIDFDERVIKVMGKGRKERVVLFGSKAETAIKRYIAEERASLIKLEDQRYLFVNYVGGQLTSRSVQRVCEMFRKYLKIDRALTPHKLRHSFATHLLSQGADLRMVQELLGHSTLASTEIYTHVASSQLAKMCEEKHPLNVNKKLSRNMEP